MFGARVEDKKWYLCVRRGEVIKGTAYPYPDGKWQPFVFSSQKQAKACADDLNAKFWDVYEGASRKSRLMPPETVKAMLDCIAGHLKSVTLEDTMG